MLWVKRLSLAGLVVVIALVGIGSAWQSWATARDAERAPMPGVLIDLGGRKLHLLVDAG